MTRIILVRHGETEWNAGEIFRGRRDVRLNEIGKEQAQLLGTRLDDTAVEAVYSSPLRRAVDTAESIAGHHGLHVRVDERLVDIDYGDWEGLTRPEVEERHAEAHERWLKEPHLVTLPGGESLHVVRERTAKSIDDILSEHSGTVVLVSHRVVAKILVCAMLAIDNSRFWDIRLDLCGFSVFEHEAGRFVLIKHNDTCHLAELRRPTLADF